MKLTTVLMLALFIGGDLESVSVHPSSKDQIEPCVQQASALNDMIKLAQEAHDDEERNRVLSRHRRLGTIQDSELEDAKFVCEVVILFEDG